MKKSWTVILVTLSIIFTAAGSAEADVKITTRTTSGGQILEGTTYLKGARQRSEQTAGGGGATLLLCDRQQRVQLNNGAKLYLATSIAGESAGGEADAAVAKKKGGRITYTSTTIDTGERKQMFGFAARRLKSSITSESSPDACNREIMRAESDGWYVDLGDGAECPASAPNYQAASAGEQSECQDDVRFKQAGTGKLGYPAMVTTTVYMKDGQSFLSTQEIVALETTTLDAALFEVPAGYGQAKSFEELSGIFTATSAEAPGVIDASDRQIPAASAAPKGADWMRIGVVEINNQTERSISEGALRDRLIDFFDDNGVDAISLTAASPAELVAEAKSKGCHFILYTDVVNLKQSGASKLGEFLGRASGSGHGGKYEANLEFKVLTASDLKQVYQSTVNVKEEGGEESTLTVALEREAQAVAAEVKQQR